MTEAAIWLERQGRTGNGGELNRQWRMSGDYNHAGGVAPNQRRAHAALSAIVGGGRPSANGDTLKFVGNAQRLTLGTRPDTNGREVCSWGAVLKI